MRGRALWIELSLVAVGCAASPGDEPDDTGSVATSGEATTGATETETEPAPEESSSTTSPDVDPGDPLYACHELPAAAIAQWVEGPATESSATSTAERIAAAGRRTWPLALEILRTTDATAHPSLASSPTAMAISLGMSHDHWQGSSCATSIHEVVGWTENGDALYQTLGASINELVSRSLPAEEGGADAVELELRPSVWTLDGGMPPAASPVWGGRSHSVAKDADGALAAINEVMNCVIETESHGLIVDFLPPSMPAMDTTNFEVDVAFLTAPWAVELEGGGTLAFTKDGGMQVDLPSIYGTLEDVAYYDDQQLVLVDVPLRGDDLVVELVMPKAEAHPTLADFVAMVDADTLAAARTGADYGAVELSMPKVAIDSTTIDYYMPLGFECELFTMRSVFHGAAVEIDEKGIKAAAAAVNEGWGSGTGEPEFVPIVLDRPFLFFVYDRTTEHVLFSGRYGGDT